MEKSTLKQRRLMLTSVLAFIGWIFVIGGLFSLSITPSFFPAQKPLPRSSPTPYTGSPVPHTSTTIELDVLYVYCFGCAPGPYLGPLRLKAIITLPLRPIIYQSTSVLVSVIPEYSSVSRRPEPGQTQVSTVLTPVLAPVAYLGAQLSASAFDVDPQKQNPQQFGENIAEFDFSWTITPKYANRQTLIVIITAQNPAAQGENPVERTLTTYVAHLTVGTSDVSSPSNTGSKSTPTLSQNLSSPPTQPFLSLGHVTLSELLVILVGSILNVPWIMEILQKKKEAKEKKQPT